MDTIHCECSGKIILASILLILGKYKLFGVFNLVMTYLHACGLSSWL